MEEEVLMLDIFMVIAHMLLYLMVVVVDGLFMYGTSVCESGERAVP